MVPGVTLGEWNLGYVIFTEKKKFYVKSNLRMGCFPFLKKF